MPPILVGNYLVYNFETNYFAENFLTKLSRCTEDNEKITWKYSVELATSKLLLEWDEMRSKLDGRKVGECYW